MALPAKGPQLIGLKWFTGLLGSAYALKAIFSLMYLIITLSEIIRP